MKFNQRRLLFLLSVIILFSTLLVGKLYIIQIVEGKDFRAAAKAQYDGVRSAAFDRGAIYFTTKDGVELSAATLKSGYTLAINPTKIESATSTYENISQFFPIVTEDFYLKAAKRNDPYEELTKHVSETAGKSLLEKKIPGVELSADNWRFYPYGGLAAQTIGLVGYKGNDFSGRYGLEKYYNSVLQRQNNNIFSNFFADIFSNVTKSVSSGKQFEGDLAISIEPTVEGRLESVLDELVIKWTPKEAGGIIMDPKTGEIFAFASRPSFDPNSFSGEQDVRVFSNPLVENAYEMGSIIKPITMAAGLDAGVVTATTTYDDKGFVELDGAKLSNFDHKGRGTVSMQEVLNQSLNTGATYVMQRLGRNRLSDYFLNFGIGEETGIDLPNESGGLISNLKSPRDIEHATASFGQGIAMTPIMTVRALAALGNGGHLVTPHIVNKIDYTLGFSNTIKPEMGRQVIKAGTSEEITRMLIQVVDKALLNGAIKMPHYSVAAKTGTAQIAKPGGGGYYDDRYLHSFFGYFPAFNPRFIIFLYLNEPVGASYASNTLTDPFENLVKFLINYYNIPPDR